MGTLIRATLRYARVPWIAMYVLPLLALGPLLILFEESRRVLSFVAFLMLFFAAFGWMFMLSTEDREKRLQLHGILPIGRKTIAIARQLSSLLHQLPGFVLAGLFLAWIGHRGEVPPEAILRYLFNGIALALLCNQVALLAEELKFLAVRSKIWSVVAGALPVPCYMATFEYLINALDGGEPKGFFSLATSALHNSLGLGFLVLFTTFILGILAVEAFSRRKALSRLPWMGLDGRLT